MGIAGNFQIGPDEFRERGYSLNGEYLLSPTFGLGASSLITRSENDRLFVTNAPYTRQAHGLTLRWSPFHDLVLLGEADALLATDTDFGFTGLVQADYELLQGLHAMATLEALDAGARGDVAAVKGAGEPAFGGWLSVNWFAVTHLDFRIDLLARQEAPLTIQAQSHFYF
jgi:hypothetical protein